MFWHSAATSNAIDNLLDQPEVTLTTILDQDEVLMEIRGMNKKLIEYLTRLETMHELLDLITTVPSADIPIPLQYKYPNTACEVLTSDVCFAQKIAAEFPLMEKIFLFFRDAEPPLNPLLASYTCRVLSEVIVRKLDQNWYNYQVNVIQIMGYLTTEPNILDWMLKHVETSAVCDFLHKLVMNVEGIDMRINLYEWLECKEQFFTRLVNMMDKRYNKEAHMNICHLVGDLLFALQDESSSSSQDRSMDSEPFLLALKSHLIFERLLDVIFGEDTRSQSSIVCGLEMLLALLGIAKKPTKLSSGRAGRDRRRIKGWAWFLFEDGRDIKRLHEKLPQDRKTPEPLPDLMKVDTTYETNEHVNLPNSVRNLMIGKMESLLRFLQCPPSARVPLRLSNGTLNAPLGMERLAIVRFIAHIITLHDTELNQALIDSGVLGKALDLFWEFPWNNFLHHYVCQILIQISKITRSNNCAKFILLDYGLSELTMEAFGKEDLKCGYMGHLAKITSAWVESFETNETVKGVVQELDEAKPELREKYRAFCTEGLQAYYAKSTQLLAGAAVPTSGVSMSSTTHNYESDPGVTWDSTSGTGMNSENDNNDNDFEEASTSANFGTTDRYDDEKSKAIFEMFCFERSNSGDDEDDDVSFNRVDEGISADADPDTSDQTNEDLEWKNPDVFLQRLEEQVGMISQVTLNGAVGDTKKSFPLRRKTRIKLDNIDPWAGKQRVQMEPWVAFEFNEESSAGTDDNWAKFDQSFPASTEFGDFTNATEPFGAAPESAASSSTPSANNTPQEEAKQSQL